MLGALAAGASILALLTFVLVAYAGPVAVRAGGPPDPGIASVEPGFLTPGALRDAARLAAERTRREVGFGAPSTGWLEANVLVWHYTRRIAAVGQALLFAAIGALVGFWGRYLGKRDPTAGVLWGGRGEVADP